MAKFDVFRLREGSLVVDCQADLLDTLATRIVAPLLPVGGEIPPMPRLNPIFEVEGESYYILTQSLASVPTNELKVKVTSLADHELAIGNALDMLISGF